MLPDVLDYFIDMFINNSKEYNEKIGMIKYFQEGTDKDKRYAIDDLVRRARSVTEKKKQEIAKQIELI